jgi:pilus assembly protein FimV
VRTSQLKLKEVMRSESAQGCHPGRWHMKSLIASLALIGLGSFVSLEAHALSLGRMTVQSALGEPLRAEIEIPDISADEAASLRTSVAPPDVFKAAGLEYTALMSGLQIRLERRADGRSFLRLSSSRPVSEPFVDLILEANWAQGKITRDYTMLFDPPNLRQSTAPAPLAPQVGRAPSTSAPSARQAPASAAPAAPTAPAPRAAAPTPTPRETPVAQAPSQSQVQVRPGDTAGKIAAQVKAPSVSLDQMLLALLRSNPDAFIGGNVNRLKSGALLDVPSTDAAAAVPPGEARQTIVAQSRDFNEFRRRLAENAPAAQVAGADRQATGQLQTRVEDSSPAPATPDKLTLSKGAVKAVSPEDRLAADRQAQDESARVAELSKNIADLNKLGVAVPAAAPTALVTPPTSAAPTPDAAPAATIAGSLPAGSAPIAESAANTSPATAAVVAPVVAPVAVAVASPGAPAAEPSLIDELLENPAILPAAGGLLLLLLGFALVRYRQRKNALESDSSFLESRAQPDSFFGASGGQQVDTSESMSGSSMVYSPSQLDAAGDVDPVAEADVYLAYGRDLQAEEILREAIRATPQRVAVYLKLLEIYAKRRDPKAFQSVASEAFQLTRGAGGDWAQISRMGSEIDPLNPLYRPGGTADSSSANTEPVTGGATPSLDLDLDLDLPEIDPAAAPKSSPLPAALAVPFVPTMSAPPSAMPVAPVAATPAKPVAPAVSLPEPSLDTDNSFDFDISAPAKLESAEKPSPASAPNGMLEFDLGALSLDLDEPSSAAPAPTRPAPMAPVEDAGNPLETKLALAEEFRAIGDEDGARALAEEVQAQASGALKSQASAFLNALV